MVEVVVESKRHLNAELFHHDFARAVGEAPTLVVELLKCLPFGLSLCNLCVLCVSVVWFYSEFINHRDTEDTEVAQRRARWRLLVQSLPFNLFPWIQNRIVFAARKSITPAFYRQSCNFRKDFGRIAMDFKFFVSDNN